ncbi:MAG: DUF6588 family protein [Bacteroidota bacterium]
MRIQRKLVCIAAIVFGCLLMPGWASAQNEEDLAQFLKAKREDASNLVEAYMSPIVKGISYGMSQGWYHTAKAHKTLGFDLGVSVNVVNFPKSDNYFDPKTFLTSSTVFTSSASNGLAPTVIGPKDQTSYTSSYDPGDGNGPRVISISGPEGLDLKEEIGVAAIPVPMAQLGIGIYKNTDLKIRLVPQREVGSSKIKMLGFGVLHDIKQHIPGIKLMPFDLSVLVAYNSVKGSTNLEGELAKPSGYSGPQEMNYTLKSWVLQALISKKFSVVTVYGGLGYSSVKTDLDVIGEYVIASAPVDFTVKNPVSINFEAAKTARLTGGVRLKFGPIYLNGEYTLQKYSTYTVGFGVAVR